MKPVAPDSLRLALDRLFQRTAYGIRPGLEIIIRLLEELDHPERDCPYVHVAGTNGKGSVCALVESVLRHAGYRTGLYTSPHLLRFNERVQTDGQPIDDAKLAALIELIEPVADRIALEPGARDATFFECSTAMAWEHFRRSTVDWAIIETGMGGRWDATNIGVPAVSVITGIGVDHVNFLGAKVEGIAAEKAGIIKPGVPVVCGQLESPAIDVVERTAREQGVPLIRADQQVRIQRMDQDWSGQKIKVETDERSLRPFRLPLIGRHQVQNCAVAVSVIETLSMAGKIEVSDDALRAGLSDCVWLARCQVLERDPVVVLDVAHNPAGAAALAQTLKDAAKGRPVGMVVGFLKDKDAAGCLAAFGRAAKRVWAVPILAERGMSAEEVRLAAEQVGVDAETKILADALDAARAWAREEGGVVCIAGSLYLAGEVLKAYEAKS